MKSYGFQIVNVRVRTMAKEWEEDAHYAQIGHDSLWNTLRRIEGKLDMLISKEQPKDRQSKEKAIKDSLREYVNEDGDTA